MTDVHSQQADAAFFQRSDAHIELSNQQLPESTRGAVAASMMYGMARFDAWLAACDLGSADALRERRDATIDYFVAQFRIMLEDNVDDYITGFDRYMAASR